MNTDIIDLDIENSYETATKGQRFANRVIDVIVYYVALIFIFVILYYAGMEFLIDSEEASDVLLRLVITLVVVLLYYSIFEYKFGKTFGKMITKTKVIRGDGFELTFGDCLLRSLSRLVPFEAWSIFFHDNDTMWHDNWTNTYVVQDRIN
jgi:uncharacterized RDD family membrane protein YckC